MARSENIVNSTSENGTDRELHKLMFYVTGDQTVSYSDFSRDVLTTARSLADRAEMSGVKCTLTQEAPPKKGIIPFRTDKVGVLSLYCNRDCSILKNPEELIGDFFGTRTESAFRVISGYRVIEAVPITYIKDWEDGEPTPGLCLLTFFRKKPDIDYNTFLHRWHNGHSKLSLEVHPLWHYNRNVVEEQIFGSDTDDPVWFDGIVEENLREREHLFKPSVFFGSPFTMLWNMARVYIDLKRFLDYKSIRTYLTTEYHLKSLPEKSGIEKEI